MGFLSKLRSLLKRETTKGTPGVNFRAGSTSLFVSNPALTIATVFRCVRLLSENIANLPINYYKYKGGIYIPAEDRRLNYLLNVQPSPELNAFDFWRQIGVELLLEGNAYIVPVYSPANLGEIDRLVLCHRGTVSHDTTNDTYSVYDVENGISEVYGESEIIHIKGWTTWNPKVGVSVLSYARLAMDIASTGDNETLNRFANGGNVRGIVSNDRGLPGFGEYQDEELNKVALSLDERFQNGEHIVSLPGDSQFTPLSLTSADMQFLESRKFTVREICRFFGVHPSFVYDDTSNNYKSAEQANGAFLTHTLNPMLRNIEVELLRKLVPAPMAHRYKFEFDRGGLYACDLEGTMKYRAQRLQIGATVNEVRRMDNLPPVEDGDVPLVSANLKSIAEITAGTNLPQAQTDKTDQSNGEE